MASKRRRKLTSWKDLPPLFDPEEHNPIEWDLDSDQAEQEAQIGQIYAKFNRNSRALIIKQIIRRDKTGKVTYEVIPGSKLVRKKPIYKETVTTEEIVKTIPFAIEVWEVLRPVPKLELLPNGKWYTERWRPKVYKVKTEKGWEIDTPGSRKGKWVLADRHDFQHWDQIPDESKRIDFCLFVIQDERENDELLALHSQVLEELKQTFEKRKRK